MGTILIGGLITLWLAIMAVAAAVPLLGRADVANDRATNPVPEKSPFEQPRRPVHVRPKDRLAA